jgi:hypothetical protein
MTQDRPDLISFLRHRFIVRKKLTKDRPDLNSFFFYTDLKTEKNDKESGNFQRPIEIHLITDKRSARSKFIFKTPIYCQKKMTQDRAGQKSFLNTDLNTKKKLSRSKVIFDTDIKSEKNVKRSARSKLIFILHRSKDREK